MATGVAQQYGCALDSAVERAQAERINAIARIRARSGRCANQGGRVGDRETNARQLMEIEERPGIREAWFPGRKRPVCSGERTVNGPASPQPISMTEPPSGGLPGDRPVVYSRGTRPPGSPVLSPTFISPHALGQGAPPGAAGGSGRRIAIRTAGRAGWLLRGGRHPCRTSGFRDMEVIRFGSLRDLIVARKP